MADEKERIITERHEKEVPRQVTEERVVQEPRTVMEEKTVQVPKTVMEERVVEEERTVMEKQAYFKLVSASCKEMDGWEIVDTQGEKVGKFDDVMLDLQSGRIAYAVLSLSGGFLGMGGKDVAVPWDALSIEGAEEFTADSPHRMVLNIPRDQLENAPSFNEAEWPANPDRSWLNENLYGRYGYHPWWETSYGQERQSTDTSRSSEPPRTLP